MADTPSYKPSAFYYRKAIRDACTRAELAALALGLVLELEKHKEWIRAQGLVPPKWLITRAERDEKAW